MDTNSDMRMLNVMYNKKSRLDLFIYTGLHVQYKIVLQQCPAEEERKG